MLTSFLEGFLLGLGAAVPLGPINILIMNTALKEYKKAVMIGAGAMSADIAYLLMIFLGIATIFSHPFILNLLGGFGSLFLLYIAYRIFHSRDQHIVSTKEAYSDKNGFMGIYLQGFTLTFINPYTVAFWISVAGYSSQKNLNPMITIIGMLCAILLWITLMPYLVHLSKHKISQKVSYYLNLFSSLLLFAFGLSLLIHTFII